MFFCRVPQLKNSSAALRFWLTAFDVSSPMRQSPSFAHRLYCRAVTAKKEIAQTQLAPSIVAPQPSIGVLSCLVQVSGWQKSL